MARGDGSGGVGWLITFACLALVGLVGTGIFFVDSSSAHKAVEAAEKARQAETAAKNNLNTKVGVLNAIVGGTTNTNNSDVIKTLEAIPGVSALAGPDKAAVDKAIADFKAKLELFGDNFKDARNLNSLVSYLIEELNRKNAALVDEQNKTTKLLGDVAKAIDDNKKIAEAAVEGQKKAEADLTAARAEFEKQLADNTAKMTQLAQEKDAVEKKFGQIAEIQKLLEAKEKDLLAVTAQLDKNLKEQRKDDADLAKVPVADVIFANQLADTITINRGLQDGVRRQQTFSVYGKDETNIARATPKASVEVVQVTDAHRSECRIISGKLKDPIIKGDVLYTPAWKPGQKVHFVLGPNMDVDGDNEATPEELELLRGLIALNGGVVDAYVDFDLSVKNDKESGGIGFQTRFYVVGLSPRRDQKEVAAKLEKESEKHGVEKINIGKMLDYMGYSVKRGTRSIVSSPTPVLERRPPGAGQPVIAPPTAAPADKATDEPKAPAGEDPFGAPKKEGGEDPFAEPKKPAEAPKKAGEDPFGN